METKEYWKDAYGGIDNYCSFPCHEQIAIEVLNIFGNLRHKRILDIGGGPGIIAAQLAIKSGAYISVLEKSQYALLSILDSAWHNIVFPLYADISEPIQHDGLDICVFDLLLSFQVLEHIEESKMGIAIENMWQFLRPGGKALVSVAIESNDKDEDHKTLKPWEWWALQFGKVGFVVQLNPKLPDLFNMLGWQTFILLKP